MLGRVFLSGKRSPELAHGDIHPTLVLQSVADCWQTGSHSLGVEAHTALVEVLRGYSVVILGKEISDGAAEVPQKAIADVRAFHNSAGQHRQVGSRVVSAPTLKFADHLLGPVLVVGFPAVHEEIAETFAEVRAQRSRNHVDVSPGIVADVFAAELVYFVSRGFRTGRMIFLSGQRIPHAQDDPLSRRHIPIERPILAHLRCQIDDISERDRLICRHRRCRCRCVLQHIGETRLLLPVIHARG